MSDVPAEMVPDGTVRIAREIDGFEVEEAEAHACLTCGTKSKWHPEMLREEVRVCPQCGLFAYEDWRRADA